MFLFSNIISAERNHRNSSVCAPLMATRRLAHWATKLKWPNIPSTTRGAAVRSLYNYLGCTIHGSAHPAVWKAHEALQPFYGPRECSVFGSLIKTDAQHAALLNGIASHVHDYDDTHLETIIHPTGPVASAALAYVQHKRGISGEKLMAALVAGIEAECKVGLAVWPSHYDVGWHITSTSGSIGAAVAVGKLATLDQQRMEHAIGLASVQVIGLREMFGSDTKSFHPGRAAQAGLLAALLAERGYTSSPQALEAKRGWANVVAGGGNPRLDQYIGELGQIWETDKNTFKPFPCGIVKHPVIDAAIQIHNRVKSESGSIDAVKSFRCECQVHPLVIELTSKQKPRDGLEGKFSVFHGAAVGLLFGKAGPGQYSDLVVNDPQVIAVRDAVKATANRDLRSDEAIVTAFDSSSNKVAEIRVEHAIGSLDKPLSDAQLREKFNDQVSLLHPKDHARSISELAWKVVDARDVSSLLENLAHDSTRK